MFGYYAGNSLKVVKYFYDPRTASPIVVDDRDPCTGEGTNTVTSKGSLLPHFYTSDFDDRENTPDYVQESVTSATDLGFDNPPRWSFTPFWKTGILFRYRNFRQVTETVVSENKNLKAGLCIPFLCRNSLLYAFERMDTGGHTSTSNGIISFQDPNIYNIWTYDEYFHWAGGLQVMQGEPFPKDGSHVWAEINRYEPPVGCSAIADQGDWVGGLPSDVKSMMAGWKPGFYEGGGSSFSIPPSSFTKANDPEIERRLHFSINQTSIKLDQKDFDSWYFLSSPDDRGDVFYRSATKNVFGNAEYSIVSEPFGKYTKWGHSKYADDKSIPRFIGVIHE